MDEKLKEFKEKYLEEINSIGYILQQLKNNRVREIRHNSDPYLATHAKHLEEKLEDLFEKIACGKETSRQKIGKIFSKKE